MYPYLLPEVFGYTIPLYDVMIGIGVVAMLVYVAKRFEARDGLTRDQGNRLLVLIVVSLLFALFSSWLFDGLFHSLAEGEPAERSRSSVD
jgi:phosphatidylglycerol:prolipoprotein diacylglycerol transferase